VVKGPYCSLVYCRELESLHGGFIYVCVCVSLTQDVGVVNHVKCQSDSSFVLVRTWIISCLYYIILLFLT